MANELLEATSATKKYVLMLGTTWMLEMIGLAKGPIFSDPVEVRNRPRRPGPKSAVRAPGS